MVPPGSLQANVAIPNRQIWNDPVVLREFLLHDENQFDADYVALVVSNITLLTFVWVDCNNLVCEICWVMI